MNVAPLLALLLWAEPPPAEPASSRFVLEPKGLLQVRYTYRTDKNGSDGQTDAFEIPRARFMFKGELPKRLDFELGFDLGNFEPSLLDAYANVRAYKRHLQVRAGRMKRPLVRERLGSSSKLSEIERSTAGRLLDAGRDLGVMLHNGFGDNEGVEWAVGVFSDLEAADFIAEEADFRPVLAMRLGWNSDHLDPYEPWDRGESSTLRFGVAAASLLMLDTDVVRDRDTGYRFEGDALMKVAGVTVGAGAGLTSDSLDVPDPDAWTAFGMASYAFLESYGASVRYTFARSLTPTESDEGELTVALSGWFFDDHLRVQLDGSWLDLAPGSADDGFRFRAQLQVK